MKRQFKAGQVAKREVKQLKKVNKKLNEFWTNENLSLLNEWAGKNEELRNHNIEQRAEIMKLQRQINQLQNELIQKDEKHQNDDFIWQKLVDDLYKENGHLKDEKEKLHRLSRIQTIAFLVFVVADAVLGFI